MENESSIRIVIGGDTCPIGRNQPLFQKGDAQALLGDLLPQFEQADLVIANLECPLIEREAPIVKCGPNLGAPVDCVNGIRALGVDVVGLANNHIMDHGPQGLRSTIRALDENGIAYVGAGQDLEAARKILVREVGGLRIGILAMAEHEFGIAEGDEPGANPLDVIDFVREVSAARLNYDKLIVLLHGGNEHYPYPRPSLQKTCRFLVEQGAGAVVCQHSHCIGCMETYRGAPIIYGQGNLLFDMPSQTLSWHEGCLVQLTMDDIGHYVVRMIPFRQTDGDAGARRISSDEETNWRCAFDERSRHLSDPKTIMNKWNEFCVNNKRHYLHTLHGRPTLFRRLAGKLDLLHILDAPDKQRSRLNIIRCQSHREALEYILEMEAARENR